MEAFLVASGGVAGAVSRWKLTSLSAAHSTHATLAINSIGSFVLGATVQLAQSSTISSKALLLVGTGFCGSFTTLSTFSVDVASSIEKGHLSRAMVLVLATNVLGVTAAALGFGFARKVKTLKPFF